MKIKPQDISFHILRMDIFKKEMVLKVGEYVEKLEPLYTVSWYVNWCSHYGKNYGGS